MHNIYRYIHSLETSHSKFQIQIKKKKLQWSKKIHLIATMNSQLRKSRKKLAYLSRRFQRDSDRQRKGAGTGGNTINGTVIPEKKTWIRLKSTDKQIRNTFRG